ncbi:plant/protein (DUF668) [Wolffia australiana]
MVAEPWTPKMRRQDSRTGGGGGGDDGVEISPGQNFVGILSFEMAGAMSRIVHLHRSLSPPEISRLHGEVLKSHGVRTLVSSDEARLLELVAAEKLVDLDRAAAVVSRLGRRCRDPALAGFEHVYADLLCGRADAGKLGLPPKDIDTAVKKMDRLVTATMGLHAELEALNELEQGSRKFLHGHTHLKEAYEQKIQRQRREVRQFRDVSLWSQTFDGAVSLMASAVCAVHARISLVFGGAADISRRRRPVGRRSSDLCSLGQRLPCGPSPVRLFTHCLNLSSPATEEEDDDGGRSSSVSSGRDWQRTAAPRKNRLAAQAGASTVGGAALALHYANVIVIVEKFLKYPNLVGEEARDDLYQMLPTSLRSSLRKALREYVKELAIYDAPVAHEWRERLGKVLAWLGPMAHGMVRWQTERSFEQQQMGPGGSVLLVQTLFFADREKTEAVLCELLVGLNYICRYEHQQSALLDCNSSIGFEDCLDWDSPF